MRIQLRGAYLDNRKLALHAQTASALLNKLVQRLVPARVAMAALLQQQGAEDINSLQLYMTAVLQLADGSDERRPRGWQGQAPASERAALLLALLMHVLHESQAALATLEEGGLSCCFTTGLPCCFTGLPCCFTTGLPCCFTTGLPCCFTGLPCCFTTGLP